MCIGTNFTSTSVSNKKLDSTSCKSECTATSQCVAYAFSGVDGCQLKLGTLSKRLFNSSVTSHVRTGVSVPNADARTYSQFKNILYTGVASSDIATPCSVQCDNDPLCIGYFIDLSSCLLVQTLEKPAVTPNAVFYLDTSKNLSLAVRQRSYVSLTGESIHDTAVFVAR